MNDFNFSLPLALMQRATIILVTPALAAANNGNWQTASRWQRFLRSRYRVLMQPQWDGQAADLMLALHARRSADSIARWRASSTAAPLGVVLTGTDLYRDIQVDDSAQASLQAAQALIVLNERGALALPPAQRHKAQVCLQSASRRKPLQKSRQRLRALMVGHLRPEKAPEVWMAAARRLRLRGDLRFDHIGEGLDPALAELALATMRDQPSYRWLGGLAHGATRERIARAHILVHSSVMEGGAHVVIEAVMSGTPVLASRIDGNVGLLGSDYGGYFDPGDDIALARLIEQCREDPAMLAALQAQCAVRSVLFETAHERTNLHQIVEQLLEKER